MLLDACRRAGIPSVSLWAAVPHYVQLAPSPPRGDGALRAAGRRPRDRDRRHGARRGARASTSSRSRTPSRRDADTAGYVEELERRADSLDWLEESDDLPSGEALAAEITRFLREREDEDGDAPESGGAGLGAYAASSVGSAHRRPAGADSSIRIATRSIARERVIAVPRRLRVDLRTALPLRGAGVATCAR